MHDQVTVTGPLFQPLPLAGVRLTNAIVGAVASYWNPKVPGALFPARSLQLPSREPFEVSLPP